MAIDTDLDFYNFLISHRNEFSREYIDGLFGYFNCAIDETTVIKKRTPKEPGPLIINVSEVYEYFPNIIDTIKKMIDHLQQSIRDAKLNKSN